MKITLLGDSILDNYSWVNRDLCHQLRDKKYEVYNYAVDEIRVADIIDGYLPPIKCLSSRSYPYPVASDGRIYPLSFPNSDIVILSIGGNDTKLKIPLLMLGINQFIPVMFSSSFIEDFNLMIKTIFTKSSKLILLTLFSPYVGKGSTYHSFSSIIEDLLFTWKNFIIKSAMDYNFPILDLGLSINNKDRSFYGEREIDLSEKSCNFISEALEYIIMNYSGYGIISAENGDTTKLKYDKEDKGEKIKKLDKKINKVNTN